MWLMDFQRLKTGGKCFMYMGVSKNKGTPKWMVKIMENPITMDDLGGKPTIFGNIYIEPQIKNKKKMVWSSTKPLWFCCSSW